MKYFRINIYLSVRNLITSFFNYNHSNQYEYEIRKLLLRNSKKKYLSLTSQCRVSFLFILKYLKKSFPKKNEIIFCAYNLPEMVNVAKNLNFKIIFSDLEYSSGFYNLSQLKKKLNKKTAAVVLTNMFNTYEDSIKLKKICKNKNINIIEDNAIYFDNYKIINKKKKFSGTVGDFSIYSFNIMKNISALYGGAVVSNDYKFHKFLNLESEKLKNFDVIILIKQILIFFILKTMSIKFLYKNLFFNLIKKTHINNNRFFLKIFYPSLKFKIKKFPKYYFARISLLSKKLIFNQLANFKKRANNHKIRKINNNYYNSKFKSLKTKKVKTINIYDFNYQNFMDFPILVKNKNKLNNFLLSKGIETRAYHYRNCEKIFVKGKIFFCKNAKNYENEIICLPNHRGIKLEYIDYIVDMIAVFYSNNIKI